MSNSIKIISNNIDIEVKDIIKDTEGWYIQLNVLLEGKSLSLINLYGPNKDNSDFFTKVQNKVEMADTDFQIIAGDFNSVLDNEMDKVGGKASHANKKSREFLNVWREECDLIDIWWHMHPNMRRYTYHQLQPQRVFTRLDFFLISMGLTGFV